MEITKENHTIVRVTEIATKTSVELNTINHLVNSFLHDLHAKSFAGEEIVKAMDNLRTLLEDAPSIREMIEKA
jgi:hypothetical protein